MSSLGLETTNQALRKRRMCWGWQTIWTSHSQECRLRHELSSTVMKNSTLQEKTFSIFYFGEQSFKNRFYVQWRLENWTCLDFGWVIAFKLRQIGVPTRHVSMRRTVQGQVLSRVIKLMVQTWVTRARGKARVESLQVLFDKIQVIFFWRLARFEPTEVESCNLWSKGSTSKPPLLDSYWARYN